MADTKQKTTTWYLAVDGDDMGHLVEESLLEDDTRLSKEYEQMIIKAFEAIREHVESTGGRSVFSGGDNMLIEFSGTLHDAADLYRDIADIYKNRTKHTLTGGLGSSPSSAHKALVVGKNNGKDQLVVWDADAAKLYKKIRDLQKEILECEKTIREKSDLQLTTSPALKYRSEQAVAHYRRLRSIGYDEKRAARFIVSLYRLADSSKSDDSTDKENPLQKFFSDGETAWALFIRNIEDKENRARQYHNTLNDCPVFLGQKVVCEDDFGRVAYVGRKFISVEWLKKSRTRVSIPEFVRLIRSGKLRLLQQIRIVK